MPARDEAEHRTGANVARWQPVAEGEHHRAVLGAGGVGEDHGLAFAASPSPVQPPAHTARMSFTVRRVASTPRVLAITAWP
jgi:hypothetical protein